MQIRALRPDEEDLFRQAHEWTEEAPEWFRQLNRVFGWKDFEAYYEQACEANQVSFGVFEGEELIALIALIERAKGLFEAELSARRGAEINLIAHAVREVGNALIASGRVECYIWVARRNKVILETCQAVGFHRTGVSLLKGSYKIRLLDGTYRERLVEWLKLSSNNEEWKLVKGAEANDDPTEHAGEHLRLADADRYTRHLRVA